MLLLADLGNLRKKQIANQRTFDPSKERLQSLRHKFTVPDGDRLKSKDTSVITINKESKWLAALQQEAEEKKEKLNAEEAARQMRIEELFHETEVSDEDEDKLDKMAVDENIQKFMRKLDRHLDVEKALLKGWKTEVAKKRRSSSQRSRY